MSLRDIETFFGAIALALLAGAATWLVQQRHYGRLALLVVVALVLAELYAKFVLTVTPEPKPASIDDMR